MLLRRGVIWRGQYPPRDSTGEPRIPRPTLVVKASVAPLPIVRPAQFLEIRDATYVERLARSLIVLEQRRPVPLPMSLAPPARRDDPVVTTALPKPTLVLLVQPPMPATARQPAAPQIPLGPIVPESEPPPRPTLTIVAAPPPPAPQPRGAVSPPPKEAPAVVERLPLALVVRADIQPPQPLARMPVMPPKEVPVDRVPLSLVVQARTPTAQAAFQRQPTQAIRDETERLPVSVIVRSESRVPRLLGILRAWLWNPKEGGAAPVIPGPIKKGRVIVAPDARRKSEPTVSRTARAQPAKRDSKE